MDFPEALTALFNGKRVRRISWDAEAFLLDIPGSHITVEAGRPLGDAAPDLVGTPLAYRPHIDVYIGGEMVPWTANQTDMHARDWEIL